MGTSLTAAVLLQGGVYPQEWIWSALGLSLAALLALAIKNSRAPSDPWANAFMGIVLAWMLLQLVPLPPAWVARIAPENWRAVAAARAMAGVKQSAWVSLSVAPPATFERLLDVVPVMAAFVVAREMAWWWRGRIWVAVAPVLTVAFTESLLGLIQFYFLRGADGETGSVSGSYVNRDHFAGLLEMGFPLAVILAISVWRKTSANFVHSLGPALRISLLLAAAASLLIGVVVSQSRMGFLSILAGVEITTLVVPLSLAGTNTGFAWRRAALWAVPCVIPLAIIVLLPTRELLLRFAETASTQDVAKTSRVEIWRDTLRLIGAYKWTGAGLGAFEHGFYHYKVTAPVNTIDFAHNDYLQILAELGIPGGLMVGALAVWIASRTLAVVLWMRGTRNWELAVGLFASLATIAVHSLADFNLYIPANGLTLAWLSGIAVSPGLRSIDRNQR